MRGCEGYPAAFPVVASAAARTIAAWAEHDIDSKISRATARARERSNQAAQSAAAVGGLHRRRDTAARKSREHGHDGHGEHSPHQWQAALLRFRQYVHRDSLQLMPAMLGGDRQGRDRRMP